MTQELTIDPEFSTLLGSPTEAELAELESLLAEEGWRPAEAIYVWANHDDTILDGHNRYAICKRLGIKFKTKAMTFESRGDAMRWIYRNQAGRRNLTPGQLSYIRGRVYEEVKQTKAEAGAKGGASKGQNDPCLSTAQQLGSEFGVSPKTIKRDAAFAKSVDAKVAEVPDDEKAETKKKLLANKRKPKAATEPASSGKGATVSWTEALKTASRQKVVTTDDMAQLLNKQAIPDVRKGLSILSQGRGFLVEKRGEKFVVQKAAALPVSDLDGDVDLLRAIKSRVVEAKKAIDDGNNHLVRWDLCMDLCIDLLNMLKHVK